ncbi:protein TonB [Hymenobacter luteus]|uniref:Protein TonB n=2 Tax=Hymenobacter TaxID=89966 RepID=A0A7W9WE08_9BACT|nr:TonB family protein [Hymenobacter latericoloratus]MBB4603342.1 protein TonB [Hymenobacter latericoloratus]MBB6061100.1 protein TonB [Hymenobacter luteus]
MDSRQQGGGNFVIFRSGLVGPLPPICYEAYALLCWLLLPTAALAQNSYNWWDARPPAPVTAPPRPARKPAVAPPAPAAADSLPLTTGGYLSVEQVPVFPGGQEALAKAIRKTLKRPSGPRQSGRVLVNLVVRTTGEVTDVQVAPGQGLNAAYAAAAVECIRGLPRFEPGKRNGKTADTAITLPVLFP